MSKINFILKNIGALSVAILIAQASPLSAQEQTLAQRYVQIVQDHFNSNLELAETISSPEEKALKDQGKATAEYVDANCKGKISDEQFNVCKEKFIESLSLMRKILSTPSEYEIKSLELSKELLTKLTSLQK